MTMVILLLLKQEDARKVEHNPEPLRGLGRAVRQRKRELGLIK